MHDRLLGHEAASAAPRRRIDTDAECSNPRQPHSAFNISSSIGVSHGFRNKAVFPELPEISVGGGRKPSGGAVFQSAPERLVTYYFISVVHVTPNTGTERLGRPSAFAC